MRRSGRYPALARANGCSRPIPLNDGDPSWVALRRGACSHSSSVALAASIALKT
jgi:hypothetical protein